MPTLAYGCVGGQETAREGGVVFCEAVGHEFAVEAGGEVSGLRRIRAHVDAVAVAYVTGQGGRAGDASKILYILA